MSDLPLPDALRDALTPLVRELGALAGVRAVVLGGSRARGRDVPDSDVDLGLLYSESSPFSIEALREIAARHSDAPPDGRAPVVTDFYEWGPWVNGGAWLRLSGQRVDLLYRSVEHVERVIEDCERGRFEQHYGQQPPFGFLSSSYLGELRICVPWIDDGCVRALKLRTERYPDALRSALVESYLWSSEFALAAFAGKSAERGDVFSSVATLARALHGLVVALFALNREHLLNDRTALAEIEGFALAPRDFSARVRALLAHPGAEPQELLASVDAARALLDETVALAGDLYARRRLPG